MLYEDFRVHSTASKCVYWSVNHELEVSNLFNIQTECTAIQQTQKKTQQQQTKYYLYSAYSVDLSSVKTLNLSLSSILMQNNQKQSLFLGQEDQKSLIMHDRAL